MPTEDSSVSNRRRSCCLAAIVGPGDAVMGFIVEDGGGRQDIEGKCVTISSRSISNYINCASMSDGPDSARGNIVTNDEVVNVRGVSLRYRAQMAGERLSQEVLPRLCLLDFPDSTAHGAISGLGAASELGQSVSWVSELGAVSEVGAVSELELGAVRRRYTGLIETTGQRGFTDGRDPARVARMIVLEKAN
ncbi:hypothetical protein LXL04_016468 [Taraxacum kok-saghyz]